MVDLTSQVSPQPHALAHSASMEIYQRLVVDLSPEARYVLLNSIANQLRYPNNHTHYFSCAMLHLFAETSDERMQEQITSAMLEATTALHALFDSRPSL